MSTFTCYDPKTEKTHKVIYFSHHESDRFLAQIQEKLPNFKDTMLAVSKEHFKSMGLVPHTTMQKLLI